LIEKENSIGRVQLCKTPPFEAFEVTESCICPYTLPITHENVISQKDKFQYEFDSGNLQGHTTKI